MKKPVGDGRRHPWIGRVQRLGMHERLPVRVRRGIRPITVSFRFIGVGSQDVLVASYPRSGSTWLRFLLTEVLTGRPTEWDVVNRTIPDLGRHQDAPALLPDRGRLIKTHDRSAGPCRKAVYLVRDVRDVVLSEYRWRLRGGSDRTLDQHVAETLAADTPMSLFGSWPDHVAYWLGTDLARCGDLLLVRFEDLRADPAGKLAEALAFLGVPASAEAVAAAIENNSVRRMKDKEDRALNADVAAGDARFRWVGEGSVMGWRSKLDGEQAAMIETRMGDALARLGYPVDSGMGGGA